MEKLDEVAEGIEEETQELVQEEQEEDGKESDEPPQPPAKHDAPIKPDEPKENKIVIDHSLLIKASVDANMSVTEREHPGFKIHSIIEEPDMSQLPGDPVLYSEHPPKGDYYDVFYFETRVRDMINEFIEPWKEAAYEDKERAAKLRLDYNLILERLHELESYALLQEWKLKPSRQFYALFEDGLDGEHEWKTGPG